MIIVVSVVETEYSQFVSEQAGVNVLTGNGHVKGVVYANRRY